jgi:LacI family transcriptional regulator
MAAVGAMLAFKSMGFKIPEEVGIVGFSNWQFCAIIEPSLSSVSQPGFKMGETATQMLLDMIEQKLDPASITAPIVLETELLVRKSSVK